jgi:hypothetical protein
MAQLVGQGSPILTAGIVHKVAIQVGNGRRFVVVAVDGRVRLRWPGEEAHKLDRPGLDEYPPPRFPTDLQSQMPPAGKIGLCVTGSRVEILSAELRPTTPSDSIEEPK